MPKYRIGHQGEVVEAKRHRIHYIAQAKYGHRAQVRELGTRNVLRIRKYGHTMAPPQDRKGRSLFAGIMQALGL